MIYAVYASVTQRKVLANFPKSSIKSFSAKLKVVKISGESSKKIEAHIIVIKPFASSLMLRLNTLEC